MLFDSHNILGWIGVILVALVTATGWAPVESPRRDVPQSVRANPASYRPVYIPTSRGGSTGGSGGGWSGGK